MENLWSRDTISERQKATSRQLRVIFLAWKSPSMASVRLLSRTRTRRARYVTRYPQRSSVHQRNTTMRIVQMDKSGRAKSFERNRAWDKKCTFLTEADGGDTLKFRYGYRLNNTRPTASFQFPTLTYISLPLSLSLFLSFYAPLHI